MGRRCHCVAQQGGEVEVEAVAQEAPIGRDIQWDY